MTQRTRKKNKHTLCSSCNNRISSKSKKIDKQKPFREIWSEPAGILGLRFLTARLCDDCDKRGLRKMIEEKEKNSQPKAFPCPTCELLIKQGGHWNEILCLHALKNRVKELEWQLEAERQARFDWLNKYIWEIRPNSRFKNLTDQISFQFFSLRDNIEWMDGGDFEKVKRKATQLFHTTKELFKEFGL